jgi:DNA-binding MarR family transcriptional regulator
MNNAAANLLKPARAPRRRRSSLGFLLRGAYRLLVASLQERLAAHGVSHSEFLTLYLLHFHGALSPGELTTRLEVTKPAGTVVLKQLSAAGRVSMVQSQTDSRKSVITLTPTGASLIETVLEEANDLEKSMLSCFAPQERDELFRLLSKLIDHQRAGLPASPRKTPAQGAVIKLQQAQQRRKAK